MNITTDDFAQLFGIADVQLPEICRRLATTFNFEYQVPPKKMRDDVVLGLIKCIDSEQPSKTGAQRADIWETCWSENLQSFISGGTILCACCRSSLNPANLCDSNRTSCSQETRDSNLISSRSAGHFCSTAISAGQNQFTSSAVDQASTSWLCRSNFRTSNSMALTGQNPPTRWSACWPSPTE